jgi:hypothetical protein
MTLLRERRPKAVVQTSLSAGDMHEVSKIGDRRDRPGVSRRVDVAPVTVPELCVVLRAAAAGCTVVRAWTGASVYYVQGSDDSCMSVASDHVIYLLIDHPLISVSHLLTVISVAVHHFVDRVWVRSLGSIV